MPNMKPGDHVHHGPCNEDWIVAAVDIESGALSPMGWPETIAKIGDCTLIESASDEYMHKIIERCMKLPASDIRRRMTERYMEKTNA
jgi:hypothetical protein